MDSPVLFAAFEHREVCIFSDSGRIPLSHNERAAGSREGFVGCLYRAADLLRGACVKPFG